MVTSMSWHADGLTVFQSSDGSIPWEVRMSRSRQQAYFFNKITQESSWTNPTGLSVDEIKGLPGAELLNLDGKKPQQVRASHLLVKHRGSRRPSSWKEV